MESSKRTFAKRLSEILMDKDIPQAHLARAIGTSPQVISSYVNEKTTPDYDTLCNIADFFEVSIDWLLGRTDVQAADENDFIKKDISNVEASPILREFRQTKDTLQQLQKLYTNDTTSLLHGNSLSFQFLSSLRAEREKYNAICKAFAETTSNCPEHCGEFAADDFSYRLKELMDDNSFCVHDDCSSIIAELLRMEQFFK